MILESTTNWPEWNRKTVGFVSDGGTIGEVAVQQLSEAAVELQMVPTPAPVYIPVAMHYAHGQGDDVTACFAELNGKADKMIEDLLWWTGALKQARTLGLQSRESAA